MVTGNLIYKFAMVHAIFACSIKMVHVFLQAFLQALHVPYGNDACDFTSTLNASPAPRRKMQGYHTSTPPGCAHVL